MSTLRRCERILSYDYRKAQQDAIEALRDAEDPRATEILITAFRTQDFDTTLRQSILRVLGYRKDPAALELLEEVVETEGTANLLFTLDALMAIGRIGGERALSFLYENFSVDKAAVLCALEQQKDPRGAELASLCVDESSPASWAAFRILCKEDRPETLEFLREKVSHADKGIRLIALKTYVRLNPAEAFPYVVSALQDPFWENRYCAVEHLARLVGYGDIVGVLEQLLLWENDPQVIFRAVSTLEAQDAVSSLAELLRSPVKAAPAIFRALVRLGDPRGSAAIQYHMDHFGAHREEGKKALQKLCFC